MNPVSLIIESHRYEPWDDHTQQLVKQEILAAGIPGLVDVRYKEEASSIRIIPVFETEQDYMWYQLKYNEQPL